MAVPSTSIDGVSYVLYTGTSDPAATLIGGGRNGTLNFTKTMIPIVATATPDSFARYCPGLKLGSLSGELEFIEDGSQVCIEADRALEVGGVEMKGINSVTLNMNAEMHTISSFDSADSTVQYLTPGVRSFSLDLSGTWYDPEYDPTIDVLLTNYEGGSAAVSDIELQFGTAMVFQMDGWVSAYSLNYDRQSAAPMDWTATIMVNGDLTTPNTAYVLAQAGLKAMLDAIVADAGVTQLYFKYYWQSDATQWTGACYPSNVSITVPVDGLVTASFTLDSDGPITRAQSTS